MTLDVDAEQMEFIKEKFGYFGLAFGETNTKQEVRLYGYPGDKNEEDHGKNYGKHSLFGYHDSKFEIGSKFIRYRIGTDYGMSGGPIFIGG